MSKSGRRRLDVDALTARGLVARQCGARMSRSGMTLERAELIMLAHDDVLTRREVKARAQLLPATWLHLWRCGWREQEGRRS